MGVVEIELVGAQRAGCAEEKQHQRQERFLHQQCRFYGEQAEECALLRQEPYSSGDSSPSVSPSTEMRRERRKCRSFEVKGPPLSPDCSAPASASSELLGGDFVEADGGLEHQQHIESVAPNILDHPGNLLALNDGLMDGLAELLDEFAQAGCQRIPPVRRPARNNAGSARDLYTLRPQRAKGNWQIREAVIGQHTHRRCYHHIEVRPQTIGRVLGIGLRVAGRVAGQHISNSAQSRWTAAVDASVSEARPRMQRCAGGLRADLPRGIRRAWRAALGDFCGRSGASAGFCGSR